MYANLGDIDLDTLEEIIGADCFEAALGYIRRQAVLSQWTVGEDELWGMVQGSYGEFYTPMVYFSAQPPTIRSASSATPKGTERVTAFRVDRRSSHRPRRGPRTRGRFSPQQPPPASVGPA